MQFFRLFHLLLIVVLISGCAAAQERTVPSYNNPTGDEFPIQAWNGFKNPNLITPENYAIMRDAGFNMVNTLIPDSLVEKTLNAASQNGIKVLMNCGQSRNIKKIQNNLRRYRGNKDVAGFFITDEPSADTFQKWGQFSDSIYKYDKNTLAFVNLLPIIASTKQLGTDSYKEYIDKATSEMGLPLISFDCYPIIRKNGIVSVIPDFYKNYEIAMEVSQQKGVPFWAFCMSSQHLIYPAATVPYLSLEAFTALAYGAQGLSYYTYVQKTGEKTTYLNAPIDSAGKKTKIWYYVKDINTQIRNLTKVFLGCKVESVAHTGSSLPAGTKRLEILPGPFTSLQSANSGVLVSHLTNQGRNFLVIVNHDIHNKQSVKLSASSKVIRILPTGKEKMTKPSKVTLEPGGYAIFAW